MSEADFLKTLEEEGTEIVELCSGTVADGRAFYAFVQMSIANRASYHAALAKGGVIDLNAYGAVLQAGWGREPDEATTAHALHTYTDNVKLLETIGQDVAAINKIISANSQQESAQ